jgi:hypothetical protein
LIGDNLASVLYIHEATMATLAEQLEAVETAIANAEKAQAFSSEGRSVTRANLDTLYKRRDVLQNRIDRQNNRGRGSLVRAKRV